MTEGSVRLDVTIWDPQVTASQFRLSPLHYGWVRGKWFASDHINVSKKYTFQDLDLYLAPEHYPVQIFMLTVAGPRTVNFIYIYIYISLLFAVHN